MTKLSLLLHLYAAVLWIGGMAFAHFALRPAAIATLPPPQRLPLMSAALGHFFKLVTGAIVVLLVTGVYVMMATDGVDAARAGVLVMFAGGILMMAIFGHIAFAGYPRLRRHVAESQWPAAAAQLDGIRRLVLVNLVLGVVIVAAVKLW